MGQETHCKLLYTTEPLGSSGRWLDEEQKVQRAHGPNRLHVVARLPAVPF